MLEGQRRRELRDFTSGMSLAWHSAAFQRAKKMPDLPRLLRVIVGQDEPTVEAPSPEEMLALVKRWNKQLGGEDHLDGIVFKTDEEVPQ